MTETNLFVGCITSSLMVPTWNLHPRLFIGLFFAILKKEKLDEELGSIQTRLAYRQIKAQLI